MNRSPIIFAALAAFAVIASAPAFAQSASPAQIQGLIAQGQAQTAISDLQPVLQAHPDSGVAWYLTAEAQDANGNEAAARTALANAQHYAPGLPFANQSDVAALQARLNNNNVAAPHAGISPVFIGIIGLAVLFLVLRLFSRRRNFAGRPGYPAPYGQAGTPGPYPYGQAPGGFGSGFGGSGLGSSLVGGLAAGAGFAAGERVIDDAFGHGNNQGNFQQDPNTGNGADDGLQGNPGWDDGSGGQGGGGFDPGNNW